jgi:ribosomal protein S18 acetylase RimI-like enzyme
LTGAHAHLAVRIGEVLRYTPDVAPFMSIPAHATDADWADVAEMLALTQRPGFLVAPPEEWGHLERFPGVQLVDDGVSVQHDDEAVLLGPADVPEMLELVAQTQPGPFGPRTIELGTYLGIRREGRLVAMAGERMHPPGWTEISAVCTDAAHRGQGLGSRLIRAVAAIITDRGEVPFLHTVASNTNAIRLYESLGFRLRRPVDFGAASVPDRTRSM